MHTAIGSLRLRSRGAQCDRILAVEVEGCTLRSGAGQTRSAKQIGDEDWRGRKQGGRRKEEDEEAAEAGGGRTTVIKPNNPHLAGGELLHSHKNDSNQTGHRIATNFLGFVGAWSLPSLSSQHRYTRTR